MTVWPLIQTRFTLAQELQGHRVVVMRTTEVDRVARGGTGEGCVLDAEESDREPSGVAKTPLSVVEPGV